MSKYAMLAIAVILVIFLSGCTDDSRGQLPVSDSKLDTSVANPAAVKCIEDGFELVPADNGTTMCVSPTGACNQWDYYRGDCEL